MESDDHFRYQRPVRFWDDVDIGSDFVRLACYGKEGSLMYTNFHALVFKKEDVEARSRKRFEDFKRDKQPKEVTIYPYCRMGGNTPKRDKAKKEHWGRMGAGGLY